MADATERKNTRLRIDADDLLARLNAGEEMTLVDVRNPKPWENSDVKIRGAIRIDPKELPLGEAWPKDHLLAFY